MKTQSKELVQGDYTQLVVIAAQGLDPRVSAMIGHHKMGSGPQPVATAQCSHSLELPA